MNKNFPKSLGFGLLSVVLTGCGATVGAASLASSASSNASLRAMEQRLISHPFSRIYFANHAPSKQSRQAFPQNWSHAYTNPIHNSAFSASSSAPKWLKKGVSWQYAEARSWPLSNNNAYGTHVYGARSALPTMTQFYGNSTGVSAVRGIIYAESDDSFVYAMNAHTGKLIWRNSPVGNHLMGDPVVWHNIVYVSAGSVGFNFSAVQKYAAGKPAIRGEHVSYNGVYAMNASTGKVLWHYATKGEAMATPVVKHGMVYLATGSGHVHAINAKTGKSAWDAALGGIDNMSSLSVVNGRVYLSLSVPGGLYSLNAKTGKVIWKATQPGVVNTGMGDVSPAVSQNIVVMDAVADPKVVNGAKRVNTVLFAANATTGKILWSHLIGQGSLPPAFKGGVPMIHNNSIYVGSPVTSTYQKYNLQSGKLLWTWHVPNAGPAGAGRGAATYYQGAVYISTGPDVYALNPKNGAILGHEHLGGRFGIVNPVIVGGTMYLDNSWDWVMATPLSRVNPSYKG